MMIKGKFNFTLNEAARGEQYVVSCADTRQALGVVDVTDKDGQDWFAVGQNLFPTLVAAAEELERRQVAADTSRQAYEAHEFNCAVCSRPTNLADSATSPFGDWCSKCTAGYIAGVEGEMAKMADNTPWPDRTDKAEFYDFTRHF